MERSRRPLTVTVALCILMAPACGEDEVIQTPDRIEVVEPVHPRGESRQDNFLYDAEGNLRESGESVAGLPLPRGLELNYERERTHVYATSVPRPKLLAFFGPLLFTGAVDPIGDGAIYRGATVQGEGASSVRLDVSVIRTGATSRVEITELPPMPVNPLPPAELERLYREEMLRGQ